MNVATSLQTGANVTNECAAMQGDLTSTRKLHMTAKFSTIHHHKIYKQQSERRTKIMKVNLYSPDIGQGVSQHRIRRSKIVAGLTETISHTTYCHPCKGKGRPCTGTESLYRPYGP